jgi:hypothetical protein
MQMQTLMTMITHRTNITIVAKLVDFDINCTNSCTSRVKMDKISYNAYCPNVMALDQLVFYLEPTTQA